MGERDRARPQRSGSGSRSFRCRRLRERAPGPRSAHDAVIVAIRCSLAANANVALVPRLLSGSGGPPPEGMPAPRDALHRPSGPDAPPPSVDRILLTVFYQEGAS